MPIPYFDAHCDTGTKALRSGEGLRANGVHLDLTRLAAYAPAAQVFAVFSRPAGHDWRAGYEQDSPAEALAEHGTACLDALVRELENNADLAVICRSADEARAAAAQGKIAAFLAVEGAELLFSSLEGLRKAYDKGVRLVNLTWNYRNPLCGTNQTGGGLTEAGFRKKLQVIETAIAVNRPDRTDVLDVLSKVGGFDIAGLVGVYLGAAYCRMPVVIDGFISAVAALAASRLCPASADFMIPSHCSAEPGFSRAMKELGKKPVLFMDMRLGEGSGCPLAFHLIDASLAMVNGMATFMEASVDSTQLVDIRER